MTSLKPSGIENLKQIKKTRMPASASMAARRKQCAGGLLDRLESLMESKSAFCLRSTEFGQGVDRAGVRSIESKSMSTATLNGTSRLKSPSVNGVTRRVPAPSAEAFLWDDPAEQPSPLTASTIDLGPAPPLQGGPENGRPDAGPGVSIRDQIHEAFEAVAFSCVCTLEMLLAETRERGIDDADVLNVISCDETNLSFQMGSDHQFRCCRSAKGHLFIERDTGSSGSLASIHELFADLKGANTVRTLCSGQLKGVSTRHTPDETQEPLIPKPVRQTLQTRAEQFPKGFELSDLYPYLNESQRVVIVVARAMVRAFSRGKSVNRKILRRLCYRYHGVSKTRVSRAIKKLKAFGIIAAELNADIYLVPGAVTFLIEHQQAELESLMDADELKCPVDTSGQRSKGIHSLGGDHDRMLRFIINDLFGVLGLTQSQQASNIQSLGGKCLKDLATDDLLNLQGSLVARLNPESVQLQRAELESRFVAGSPDQHSQTEASSADIDSTDTSGSKQLEGISSTDTPSNPGRDELLARMASSEERLKVTGSDVSPLAAAVLCIARDNATMGSLPAEEIFVHATEAGFTRREVNQALGELHITEIAMFSYCNNKDKYFLELMDIEGGPNGVDVLIGLEAAGKAFDKLKDASIAELRNTRAHLVDA